MTEETKIIITINKDKNEKFNSLHITTANAHLYDLMLAAYRLFGIIAKKDPDGAAFSSMFNLAKTYSSENENKDNHSDSDESK